MNIRNEQLNFLNYVQISSRQQVARNCVNVALQHNPTYLSPHDNHEAFRHAFIQALDNQYGRYQSVVEEDEHNDTIAAIAERLSLAHGNILQGARLRIGTVQKALNLYLKFIWCLEPGTPIPPHCPVDRIVLQAAGIDGNWTQLDSIEKYKHWVTLLQQHVERISNDSLSEWELRLWASSVSNNEIPRATTAGHGRIPERLVGTWSGVVTKDPRRKNPYVGELELTCAGGRSIYHMRNGKLIGTLAVIGSGADLIVAEKFESGGYPGRISLRSVDDNLLECQWNYGCYAIMKREG